MIAIPLEKKESTVISKLYGNTPYFAFLDEETGYFKVVKNIGCGDGIETAKFISSQKVDSTIFYHMGEKVYDYLKEKGLKVRTPLFIAIKITQIQVNIAVFTIKKSTESICYHSERKGYEQS